MRLHIIRHGKAEQTSPDGSDSARPLRPKGVRQATWLGHVLSTGGPADGMTAGPAPQVILSSPVLRALNTAGILARGIGLSVTIRPELSTDCNEDDVLRLLTDPPANLPSTALDALRHGSLAIVGHNPTLEALAGLLRQPSPASGITLQTGMCIVLDFPDVSGEVSAIQPRAGTLAGVIRLSEPSEED
jgi:phosphohistidine phosphatase SixA